MSRQIIREKRLCRTCKGKGKMTDTSSYNSERICPVCNGTGVEIVEIINEYFPLMEIGKNKKEKLS